MSDDSKQIRRVPESLLMTHEPFRNDLVNYAAALDRSDAATVERILTKASENPDLSLALFSFHSLNFSAAAYLPEDVAYLRLYGFEPNGDGRWIHKRGSVVCSTEMAKACAARYTVANGNSRGD
jgi:hypothetical protein